ncbi:MAG: beta-ketoacyl synthase chain length factor [Campylobacterales bacterium]|nr:beta-ketoacyl synthase chain length factor [Campylobacterales bacterium]
MRINLEILSSAYLLGESSAPTPRIKELVPNMMLRRRLTPASKLLVELLGSLEEFEKGRIVCGSAYGELGVTASLLESIKEETALSPSDFQNSVYNTAVSYLSILTHNQSEILTLSSGDKTARAVLKAGALKALDGDVLLLVCFETLNMPRIAEVNRCIDYLESAVALVVRHTSMEANLRVEQSATKGIPASISEMLFLAQEAEKKACVVEVVL